MSNKQHTKRVTITVYKRAERIATYNYRQGKVQDLLDGLRAFYGEVYADHLMTYSIDSGGI